MRTIVPGGGSRYKPVPYRATTQENYDRLMMSHQNKLFIRQLYKLEGLLKLDDLPDIYAADCMHTRHDLLDTMKKVVVIINNTLTSDMAKLLVLHPNTARIVEIFDSLFEHMVIVFGN